MQATFVNGATIGIANVVGGATKEAVDANFIVPLSLGTRLVARSIGARASIGGPRVTWGGGHRIVETIPK